MAFNAATWLLRHLRCWKWNKYVCTYVGTVDTYALANRLRFGDFDISYASPTKLNIANDCLPIAWLLIASLPITWSVVQYYSQYYSEFISFMRFRKSRSLCAYVSLRASGHLCVCLVAAFPLRYPFAILVAQKKQRMGWINGNIRIQRTRSAGEINVCRRYRI
jgi:hypothetical protein